MKTARKYEPIKETRGWYYVEYYPLARAIDKLAWLNLVITEDAQKKDIIKTMEIESEHWLNRYPIPLWVSAWDSKGDLYDLTEIKERSNLVAFLDRNGKVSLHWSKISEDIFEPTLHQEYVDGVYSNLNFKNHDVLNTNLKKKRQGIKLGWLILFLWATIGSLTIATIGYYSYWVSLVAFLYSLYKIFRTALELAGKLPKSKKEQENDTEERLKDYYYHHCQMNPDGFMRLMRENLEKTSRDEITKEAEALKVNK